MPPRLSPVHRALLEYARADKEGVAVAQDGSAFDLGTVPISQAARGFKKSFTIQVVTPSTSIRVVQHRWTAPGRHIFSASITSSSDTLHQGVDAQIVISLPSSPIGRYVDQLELTFQVVSSGKKFLISRSVIAIVGDPEEVERLRPQAPYVQSRRGRNEWRGQVVEGVAPPRLMAIQWRGRLPKSLIPPAIQEVLARPAGADILSEIQTRFFAKPLSKKTYSIHFIQVFTVDRGVSRPVRLHAVRDLEVYDMENKALVRHGVFYQLHVPGLAEKRPSVLIGDRMLVKRHGDVGGRLYEGHVHFVHETDVSLRFHGSFPSSAPGYDIHFLLNRIPIRRQHQIMNLPLSETHFAFPEVKNVGKVPSGNISTPYNPLIASNPLQWRAVKAIVTRAAGAAPFLLFGPPGTGKTVTGVEAMRQVLARDPKARILACAPSNSATDIIASRLKDLGRAVMFRFYAPSLDRQTVSDKLVPFTFMNGEGHFSHPDLDNLMSYRVIVTTCLSSAFAAGVGMPRGHFTHIFVDEAGQATEPEAMVPIRSMADSTTHVVLLGDPRQLGPLIRSPIARELGLDISYLERLMDRQAYQGNSACFVKLLKNYRSHPAILRFPNEQFYGNELQTCGDPASINSLLGHALLANKKFPVVFHAVLGQDAREASSPSFFNVEEVLVIQQYARDLLRSGVEIGIIAQYRAQCTKIRLALRSFAQDVKVGSAEEFQGLEYRVIIMSGVRSSREYITYDLKHTLGFVANPRRLNVAITRAKALLAIVGDPSVLSLDPLWRKFLNYINLNGGWKGEPISWDPRAPVNDDGGYDDAMREQGAADMDELARRIEAFTVDALNDEDIEGADEQVWEEVE
ncbi:RNA helicase [Auriscalpium vulgare]|uniref:RNA helicase n=1 Tax=Auriscalpium vulgare TaxID=40419 RepID=A0ACB8RYM9_9AGAM|nr:RNA helicase [Auriscalpium vulgare]